MPKLSNNTAHFEQPKQWSSMRAAKALEARTGRRIIHFEKGDYDGPDFVTPEHVLEAAEKALRDGYVRYAPGPGLPDLREAIAEEMTRRGRPTIVEEVIVTAGAKHSLMMSLLTLLERGDEVVFPNPGYPPDETWAQFCGAQIRHVPLTSTDWQFDAERLDRELDRGTKLLIINSPQRPSGQLVENIDQIAQMVARRPGLAVISDEIFSQIVFDGDRHVSISEFPEVREQTAVIDTFSKTYAMTGWRIGWTIAPVEMAERLSIFLQDTITNVAAFIQMAALAAMRGPQQWVEDKRLALQAKRNRMVEGLRAIEGIECAMPRGAFYALADIRGAGLSSQAFADALLEDCGVAVVPGTAFGSRGEGFVRMTYAVPDDAIDEGLARMAEFVARHRTRRSA